MFHRVSDIYWEIIYSHERNDSSFICNNPITKPGLPCHPCMHDQLQFCLVGMRGYNGLLYTFAGPSEKMTREQAEVHCKRIHSEICKVNDEATQKILSESSKTLQNHVSGNV